MLPKLCHLDNDLEIIIITYTVYILKTYTPYLGTFFFSRYPSVALARNICICTHICRVLHASQDRYTESSSMYI